MTMDSDQAPVIRFEDNLSSTETDKRTSTEPNTPKKDNANEENAKTLTTKLTTLTNTSTTTATTTTTTSTTANTNPTTTVGRFFSISLAGSLEAGWFDSVNDVYVKYSIVAGPDWIITSGLDLGITQIARYRIDSQANEKFVWNQPISVAYRSYNFYGWPQIVVSVYYFDTFGNDRILGYGCMHLPLGNKFPANYKHEVTIYSPQSTSFLKQLLSWFTRRKPELVDSNLFARGDCRSVLQTIAVGKIQFSFNLATKDVMSNGFRS